MRELKGKTAFVTGAASGIGLGLARMLAREGMNVAMADIQADRLQEARANVESFGGRVTTIPLDVSDIGQFQAAADHAEAEFGNIHVVCNNAGVSIAATPIDDMTRPDWDWIISVNLYGAINGVTTFLPRLRRHGEGGHFVNTSSAAGLAVRKGSRGVAYGVTKHGIITLTEALHNELEGSGIGASVLAPAAVKTRLLESPRHRPAKFGGPIDRPANPVFVRQMAEQGLDPDWIGERAIEAIRENELYVLTHSWPRAAVEERYRQMMAAFDRAEAFETKLVEQGRITAPLKQ